MSERWKVVIIGGGFGGLSAAQHLNSNLVDVTLIDRRNYYLFQPLLYQVATGSLSAGQVASPLRSVLSRQKSTRVWLGTVVDIDPDSKHVVLGRWGHRSLRFIDRCRRLADILLRAQRVARVGARHEECRRSHGHPPQNSLCIRSGRAPFGSRAAPRLAHIRHRWRRAYWRGTFWSDCGDRQPNAKK